MENKTFGQVKKELIDLMQGLTFEDLQVLKSQYEKLTDILTSELRRRVYEAEALAGLKYGSK